MIGQGSVSIAIVAADHVLREALTMSLSARGYAVSAFGAILEFLGDADRTETQCLVADLAQFDGLAGEGDPRMMVRIVEAWEPDLPVILLTGQISDGFCLGKTARFMTKPVDPAHLSERIRTAVR